ncbi:hypothetical protein ACLMJK_001044 [Lecanora helva]
MPPQPPNVIPVGGDHDKGPSIEAVIWIFTSIALLTAVSRVFSRLKLTRNPGWDDFWIVIAMILNLLYAAFVQKAVKEGNGRHAYYLGPEQTSKAIHWNTITFVPGVLSFAIPKLSVTILLTNVLNPRRLQVFIMYFLSFATLVGSVLAAIFLWQQCDPPEGVWNPNVHATCWDPSILTDYTIAHGALSAFVDFYLALYPCFVIYRLQISTRKKIGLTLALSIGVIAGIFAIVKCTRLPGLENHSDYTYATADLMIWTSIESSFIIIAADLPILRPVFQLFINRDTSSRNRHNKNSHKLESLSDRCKRGPSDPYSTTITSEESVERILPPNRIRMTYDVDVSRDGESISKLDKAYLGQSAGLDKHVHSDEV